MISYSDSLEGVTTHDLEGFLAHWDFAPPAGTLLAMLRNSTVVILARDVHSSTLCGYIAALSDGIVCGYISALEVRPVYRNRGIATELLNRMTERLSVYGIYLSCAPSRVTFYESAGFLRVAGMTKRKAPLPGSFKPVKTSNA